MAKDKLYIEGTSIIACTEYTAKCMGVSAQTLSNWMRQGCPRHEYGYWDIRKVVEWQLRQGMPKVSDAEDNPDNMSLAQQKTFYEGKLKAAQLESAEMRNAITRGDYLERAFVISELTRFATVMKRAMMGLGRKLAKDVAHYVDANEARRLEKEIMDTVADGLEQIAVEGVYSAKNK